MTADITTAVATRAAQQHGVVHRRQIAELGGSRAAIRWRIERGAWIPITRDVLRVAGVPESWHQRLWSALLEAGPRAVVSHRSAAALHAIPGFAAVPVEVVRPEMAPRRITVGTLHESSLLPDHHLTMVGGLPCTTLARTLFDLAGMTSKQRIIWERGFIHERRVARALDTALARSMLELGDLSEVLETLGGRGRPGTVLTRALLDERGEGYVATESELEDLLRSVLDAHGLPQPEGQRVLGGDLPAGRVDFVYPTIRLVLEADSRRHHSSLSDMEADKRRDIELKAAGYNVLRVTWSMLVDDTAWFVARVRIVLRRAGLAA